MCTTSCLGWSLHSLPTAAGDHFTRTSNFSGDIMRQSGVFKKPQLPLFSNTFERLDYRKHARPAHVFIPPSIGERAAIVKRYYGKAELSCFERLLGSGSDCHHGKLTTTAYPVDDDGERLYIPFLISILSPALLAVLWRLFIGIDYSFKPYRTWPGDFG